MRCTLKDRPATRRALVVLSTVVSLAIAAGSHAGATPEQQCQSGKNKTAGKYAACRENAEAKLAATADATKYGEAITKCGDKFAAAWQKLEAKAVAAGTTCPSVGDATGIDGRVAATTDTVAALVGGVRFVDNGDGTVTDHRTGLQWEQKTTAVGSGVNPADPHDVDNTYSWNTAGTAPNGTAFTDFLAQLNGADDGTCLIGKCDWRLPSVEELQTIVIPYPCVTPCIEAVFGPTAGNSYWTATTYAANAIYAQAIPLFNYVVPVTTNFKASALSLRAVRTGS